MYTRGDVVRSIDPFKLGADAERFWLIANDDQHPFFEEQCIAIALTTTPHDPAIRIDEADWTEGALPETTYVLPWALHSPRVEDIAEPVGRLSASFCGAILKHARELLKPTDEAADS